MPNRILSMCIAVAVVLAGCTAIPKGLTPVGNFETDRYLGKWYEIARLDHSFERNLSNVSATYWEKDNGDIGVKNRGFDTGKGVWKEIEGRARFLGDTDVGSLKVSFFGPFYGGYHIIELDDEQYQYARNNSRLLNLGHDLVLRHHQNQLHYKSLGLLSCLHRRHQQILHQILEKYLLYF